MSTANQQTLAESRALDRPSILEKESYVSWATRFLRFLDNKKEERELMRHSIDKGLYKRKDIRDPNNESETIPEPISKMTTQNKNQYFADIKMLLATKDKAGVHLDEEENDFILDNAYGDNTFDELNAAVIMMARIQPTDDKSDAKPTYDAEFISDVNASQIDMINGLLSKNDHEQRHHEKLETIIHTSADDQIDSDIVFDDPFMDNNSGQAEHDTNSHDQSIYDFETLINNIQVEAEKQRK
nr:hypothetical protein [Tanacetum cinerariifolium]